MNPVFIFLVLIAAVILWFLLSFDFELKVADTSEIDAIIDGELDEEDDI